LRHHPTTYPQDLAPSGFWLFPALKIGLKGSLFGAMEDIKSNATPELRKRPSSGASNSGPKDRSSVCVCARVNLCR
jgi:hypothetical protein